MTAPTARRGRRPAIAAALCAPLLLYIVSVARAESGPPSAAPASPPSITHDQSPNTPPAPVAPPNVETLPPSDALGILGTQVSGPSGENMGLVVDVIVDYDGKPRAAVIDFGGFLGVGSRKIAVDWHLLQFRPGNAKTPIELGLDKAALKAAPQYKPGARPIVIVGPAPPRDPATDK